MREATDATYRSLVSFANVDELNEAVRTHRNNHDLSSTEIAVLDVLSRYSCVYPGVSYLAKGTLANAVGKSRRTIIRICKRLQELGIIVQYELKRMTGDKRQTSNAIVIRPAAARVTPEMSHQKAQKPFKLINTYKDTAGSLRRSIPEVVYDSMAPFFPDDDIYKIYGVLLRAKASVDRNMTVEDHGQQFVDAFRAVIFAHKRGRVRDISSYLYAVWRQVATEIKRRLTLQAGTLPLAYDWLGD